MTAILSARQFNQSAALYDNHGRKIDYLRLAITDRCNLRCRYCMPPEGIRFIPHRHILRYEEMVRMIRLFTGLGIRKIRITGGEPFARRDCLPFLQQIRRMPGVRELHVTTNGVATAEYLNQLRELDISGINLSLDSLDPVRFRQISGKDCLDRVLRTFHGALRKKIPLKLNSVVLADTKDADLLGLAELARRHPVTVRFIEKMPFPGNMASRAIYRENLSNRLHRLLALQEISSPAPTTARLFSIKNFTGKIGIIEGHSRTFCQSCNKIRITPSGMLKTCLYDAGVLDLKAMVRGRQSDRSICSSIVECVTNRMADGRQVEKITACACRHQPSMASIGG